MNSLGKAVAVAALSCLISQMCGCASSNLVDIWRNPSFKASPLGKMLVIAAMKDATNRRIWEDAFTGELAKHSVTATSSYSLFPDAPPDTNQVIATVKAKGFDGILVTLRLPTETDKQYIQGYTSTEQDVQYNPQYNPQYNLQNNPYYHPDYDGPYYGPYWQRYLTYYRDINHPGYIDSQKVDIRAIDVSTTGKNGRLIWSATSRTPDPGSVTDVQRGIAGLVAADLTQRSIIGSKK